MASNDTYTAMIADWEKTEARIVDDLDKKNVLNENDWELQKPFAFCLYRYGYYDGAARHIAIVSKSTEETLEKMSHIYTRNLIHMVFVCMSLLLIIFVLLLRK